MLKASLSIAAQLAAMGAAPAVTTTAVGDLIKINAPAVEESGAGVLIIGGKTYRYHHTAARRGYVSRRAGSLPPAPYSGRFGNGYTIARARWDTTSYIYVDYYIEV